MHAKNILRIKKASFIFSIDSYHELESDSMLMNTTQLISEWECCSSSQIRSNSVWIITIIIIKHQILFFQLIQIMNGNIYFDFDIGFPFYILLYIRIIMNFWNINHTKERFAILQKTQAQKRHLISMIKIKSTLQGVSTPQKSRSINSSSIQSRTINSNSKGYQSQSPKSKFSPVKKFHNIHIASSSCTKYKTTSPNKYELKKANEKIVRTIINADKLAAIKTRDQRKFMNFTKSLSRNHSAISTLKQKAKQKQIDIQNNKIFSRLIQTSPTIKRQNWIKNNINTLKYKQNLNRCKYIRPDYSIQACKLLKQKMKQNKNNQVKKQNSLHTIKKYNLLARNSMSSLINNNMSSLLNSNMTVSKAKVIRI